MPNPLRYVPYHLLGETPNIIVDGSAHHATKLTLSHWPGSATPQEFKADLSAEIVFNFIESGEAPKGVEAVSNNHFDEDGLISLYSILNRQDALDMKEFLIEVASAGDFGKCADRDAARVAFTISAWTDPERSPLNGTVFSGTHDELTAVLYEELLDRLSAIINRIHVFEKFWKMDEDFVDLTNSFIDKNKIEIIEDKEIDLAVVIIPDDGIHGLGRPPENATSWVSSVCHPMAIHNRIDCHRVLVMQQRKYQLYYRYETWVDFVSKQLPGRIDLTNFAQKLNQMEKSKKWNFNSVHDIIGRLSMIEKSESSLSPNQFLNLLKEELRNAGEETSVMC